MQRLLRTKLAVAPPTTLTVRDSVDGSAEAGERAVGIQPKLRIGSPNDPLEEEADRLADAVVQRKDACTCGGTCNECQWHGKEPLIQRKSEGIAAPSGEASSSSFLDRLGAGRPLDPTTQRFFESRLQHDFSRTRVHTDAEAAETAAALDARAFTHGNHVVFARGEFAPHTAEGERLLAHELAHVTQQRRSDAVPRIQRQPREKPVDWRPGMWARVVREYVIGDQFSGYQRYGVGETLEITSEPVHFYKSTEVTFVRPGGTSPRYIPVSMIEPIDRPPAPAEQDHVQFRVNVLSEAAFAKATGIDPAALPEGAMIPLDQARASAEDAWLYGAAPGTGFGWARAPWPAFPVPAYSTGVQWTQSSFGHFSQFSNVPGSPVIGGYRSYVPVHGYQGAHSALTGRPWTSPVPGGYFSDWLFRLMSPQSQTLVWRPGTPQHADLVSRLITQGRYAQPYTFPPSPAGTQCTNCITVPKTEMYGALGGKPVIVSEGGVYDITEFGRPSPQEPFTVEQAGRGTTMREWLVNPTVKTPSGNIETLNVSRVPPSTVWGGRGVAGIRAGGVVLLVYGAHKTKERLEEAAGTPHFGRVVAQETGSWVGGLIGSALGAAAVGAVACAPSGPGAFVCAAGGFVGGLVVGVAGSVVGAIAGDIAYSEVEEGLEAAGEVFSPVIERAIWGDKPIPPLGYYPSRQFGRDPVEYEEEKQRYIRSLGGR